MCNEESCLKDTLCVILKLQKKGQILDDVNESCDRPFLGPSLNNGFFNTRPITLYCCRNNALWTMPYTVNGTTSTSSVFRIEALDDNCCATFRVLAPNPEESCCNSIPYIATNSFFTINLDCLCAIRCLDDSFVENV